MKNKVKNQVETTKTVAKNFEEFVQAMSLTAISLFALIASYFQRDYSDWYYLLFFAGVVQLFVAFKLLVKHFNKS